MQSIKLHPPLLKAMAAALQNIFEGGSYADKEIPNLLKSHPEWGSRDRRLVAETLYDVVRWKRKYEECPSHEILLASNDKWQVLVIQCLLEKELEIVNAEQLGLSYHKNTIQNTPFEIQTSIPDWLNERGKSELGNSWKNIIQSLNEPARVFIRVNTLKTTTEKLKKLLFGEGIGINGVKNFPDALEIVGRNNLSQSRYFRDGWFEFQDIGSQSIGEICDIKPGMLVVDACAGAGGKTLQLAAAMHNKGKIIAMDSDHRRLSLMMNRAQKAGVKIVEIGYEEDKDKMKGKADLVLIDAPCSATGTLKRNPDLKWKLTQKQIEDCIRMQREILLECNSLVKPGGVLVYAVCSIFPSEGEDQIRWFLAERAKENVIWTVDSEKRLCPWKDGYDGFYMAKLKRE